MKKTLIILAVLLVSAFALFATAEDSSMTLNATVTADTDYTFVLSFDEVTKPNQTVDGWDAAKAGDAYFKINSTESVNFKNKPADIIVAVSATNWTGATNGETNSVAIQNLAGATDATLGTTANTFKVNFGAGYTDSELLGTFQASWADKSTLAADSYQSTIKIAYEQI